MPNLVLLLFGLVGYVSVLDARFMSGPPQLDDNYGGPAADFIFESTGKEKVEQMRDFTFPDRFFHYNRKSVDQEAADATDFYTHPWHKSSCNIQCRRSDIKTPPLVIVSFDGFANRYRKRNLVPSLERMGQCGARTKYMFPSYPSKTFPNHYTIATGLYPENHGIIDNYVYDPLISPKVEDVRKFKGDGYFKGEPIWSAAVRQGKKMNCLFYPGCSYNVTGYNPTVDIKYGVKMTYEERINQMTTWLKQSSRSRPDLIMAYFNQPDETGHFKKVDQEVNLELMYVENIINRMLTTFQNNNLLDCINLVIVSDHGMQTLDKRFYVDQMINTNGMLVANGVVGRVYLSNSGKTAESIVDQLKCKDPKRYRVYDRHTAPKRYHYAKNVRVGDVILEGRPGTTFYANKSQDYPLTSDHGYDYLEENMRAIFFARGPNIKPRTELPPFQNIELYNLFSDLLRLKKDVKTDGTDGFMDQVLNRISPKSPIPPKKTYQSVKTCSSNGAKSTSNFQACATSSTCSSDASTANSKLNSCRNKVDLSRLFHSNDVDACFANYCSAAVLKNQKASFGAPTAIYEILERSDVKQLDDSSSAPTCTFVDEKFERDCTNWTSVNAKISSGLQWQTLMANSENGIKQSSDLQFLLYSNFAKGPFNWMQKLTRQYAKKYSKIGVLTAAAYDYDMDSFADDSNVFWTYQSKHPNDERRPSHILRALFYCTDNKWSNDNSECSNRNNARFLAFALPNAKLEANCMDHNEYLKVNTIRLRDFEYLSNLKFFPNVSDKKQSIHWRLQVTEELWAH